MAHIKLDLGHLRAEPPDAVRPGQDHELVDSAPKRCSRHVNLECPLIQAIHSARRYAMAVDHDGDRPVRCELGHFHLHACFDRFSCSLRLLDVVAHHPLDQRAVDPTNRQLSRRQRLSQNLRWARAKSYDDAGSPGPCGLQRPAQGRRLPVL